MDYKIKDKKDEFRIVRLPTATVRGEILQWNNNDKDYGGISIQSVTSNDAGFYNTKKIISNGKELEGYTRLIVRG